MIMSNPKQRQKHILRKLSKILLKILPVFFCTNLTLAQEGGVIFPVPQPIQRVGSQRILERCWTPAELAEPVPSDTINKHPKTTALVPARETPVFQLPPLSREIRGSIRSVQLPEDRKLVALTFDLCESRGERAGYDADVVNYLRTNHVKATFYAGGQWMQSHPERTLQLMADPLFEIGNHGWTHRDLTGLKERERSAQILRTQIQYELLREELSRQNCVQHLDPQEMAAIPPVPLTFRFPFGTCDADALHALAEDGLPAIQWSIVTGDPTPTQTAEGIMQIIVKQITPGAIIIAHANGRGHGTAAALPLFIPKLQAQGYQFVTISELLAAGQAVLADTCYERKPGDNQRKNQPKPVAP